MKSSRTWEGSGVEGMLIGGVGGISPIWLTRDCIDLASILRAMSGSSVATSNSLSGINVASCCAQGDSILGMTPESFAGFGFGGCAGRLESQVAEFMEDLLEL